ncbi:hypothetical protein KJ632_00480 [Patescibacteria group bacterium]|nr:hypothetical protein [Patescibacteria group bacterium]
MKKNCLTCEESFEVSEKDRSFLSRFDVLDPVECPTCREQRRLSYRNEKTLYLRDCELCGKQTVSIYSKDKPYHVYCQSCWWSDNWEQTDSSHDFDFSLPFFEQFNELLHDAKLVALFGGKNHNSEYVNQETDDKNCYMNAGGHYNEDSFYNMYSIWGKNTVDNYWVIRSELLYECIKCENCFNCTHLENCKNCTDCHHCQDLKSCQDCFGSKNLRHKQYCYFNEQLTQEQYEEKLKKPDQNFREHFLKHPYQHAIIENCEDCTGNDLSECKDCEDSYLSEKCRDCKNIFVALGVKDAQDICSIGWSELIYNSASSGELNTCMSVSSIWQCNFCSYCFVCFSSNNCFGCIGLHRKEYCILNKQYTKQEYEELLPKIIAHLKQTGEYGQFFDPAYSPFCYNETVAQQYYPLTKEQTLASGWKWKDKASHEYLPQTYQGSYQIEKVPPSITQETLACNSCGKNYRIIEPELKFYRRQKLPIPKNCPDCRHQARLEKRPSRKLFTRNCHSCKTEIRTSYAPERPEMVYCERCYLSELT